MTATIGKRPLKYASRKTGEPVDAIGKTPVKRNRRKGIDLKVGLVDPRKTQPNYNLSHRPLTNAMIANIIDYGKKAVDQPAKPMLRPIYNAEHDAVERLLAEEIEKKVGKI